MNDSFYAQLQLRTIYTDTSGVHIHPILSSSSEPYSDIRGVYIHPILSSWSEPYSDIREVYIHPIPILSSSSEPYSDIKEILKKNAVWTQILYN